MKGIVLAGGFGTRLYPMTYAISKQMLPVYNKPMIYYPLQTLRNMGIVDILLISANEDQCNIYKKQLGDGSEYGLNLEYKIQPHPGGLPEAFILGEEFIGEDDVTLILGDNIFITNDKLPTQPNTIFTYKVKRPELYGVAEVDDDGNLINIIEKPKTFISDKAVVGLYIFRNIAIDISKKLKPSTRGELEIVDLIREIDSLEGVDVKELNGFWFDCGNPDDLLDCSNLVATIERRTDQKVGLIKL